MSDGSAPGGWLAGFNAMPAGAAEAELRACCASSAFAARVAAGRPYAGVAALLDAAGAAVSGLEWPEVLQALAAHPRIGERARGPGREAAWSRREQAGAAGADARVLAELAAGNRAYEERFGHVYLVCATGLTAGEMLERLRARLGNDEDAERRVVREELAKITEIRLRRLAEETAA